MNVSKLKVRLQGHGILQHSRVRPKESNSQLLSKRHFYFLQAQRWTLGQNKLVEFFLENFVCSKPHPTLPRREQTSWEEKIWQWSHLGQKKFSKIIKSRCLMRSPWIEVTEERLNPITRHQRIHPQGKEVWQLSGLFPLQDLVPALKDKKPRGVFRAKPGADRKASHAPLLTRRDVNEATPAPTLALITFSDRISARKFWFWKQGHPQAQRPTVGNPGAEISLRAEQIN